MTLKHLWTIPLVALIGAVPAAGAIAAQVQTQESSNARLLAAAEPFEGLTEQSFSAKPKDIDRMIRNTENAAHRVTSILSADETSALNQQLQMISNSRAKDDRSELARAAIEGYRILVSATHGTKVPSEVGLLDYSGFRYDADLKSKPVHWSDMQDAIGFANKQWQAISTRVTDPTLRQRVSDALHSMQSAASDKSAANAHNAVSAELELVDILEAYFNRRAA